MLNVLVKIKVLVIFHHSMEKIQLMIIHEILLVMMMLLFVRQQMLIQIILEIHI